jgi:hypothetical protein
MNIPRQISTASLHELASPNETHFVRLILHDVRNGSRYLLRCRSRDYFFLRDQEVGRHVLDIPLSVYMEGTGGTNWRDNKSISEDIRNANRSVTIQVLPYNPSTDSPALVGEPVAEYESPLPELKRLLTALEAPDQAHECLDAIMSGMSVPEVRLIVDHMVDEIETPGPASDEQPSETPAEDGPAEDVAPKKRSRKKAADDIV